MIHPKPGHQLRKQAAAAPASRALAAVPVLRSRPRAARLDALRAGIIAEGEGLEEEERRDEGATVRISGLAPPGRT